MADRAIFAPSEPQQVVGERKFALTVISDEGAGAGSPSDEGLTDATRGGVTVPDSVVQGATVTVTIGRDHAEQSVDDHLFSDPVLLGTRTVSADGTATVTIPLDAALGAHRIAVYAADGTLIGWAATTVTAAASGGAATAAAGELSDTGGELGAGALAAAVLLLVAGGGLVLATRRRNAAGQEGTAGQV